MLRIQRADSYTAGIYVNMAHVRRVEVGAVERFHPVLITVWWAGDGPPARFEVGEAERADVLAQLEALRGAREGEG